MNSLKRLSQLDGMRGLAALGVVAFHFLYHYHNVYGHSFDVWEIFRAGYYGVHLFFMISGFVIFWTISRSASSMDFIWSRFSRLYPMYWCSMVIGAISAYYLVPDRAVDVPTFIANTTMLHHYFGYKHVDGVYWTLMLEMAFYGWMLLLIATRCLRYIQWILLLWLLVAHALTSDIFDISITRSIKDLFLLEYIELFAIGICFYKYYSKTHNRLTYVVAVTSFAAICLSFGISGQIMNSIFVLLFLFAVHGKLKILSHPWLLYFGAISYSLYLVHQNLGYGIIKLGYAYSIHPFVSIGVAFLVTWGLADVLHRMVEKPSLKYLKRVYAEYKTKKDNKNLI